MIQIFTGIALVWNQWVLLGLLALLPISFNIFFFHLLHDQGGLIPAVVILGLNLFLLFLKREMIKPIFVKKG
jgi:putative oxidoreductase